jgi:hypothetical protein
MARRVAEFDWTNTAIGAPEHWPVALRTIVPTCLASNFPLLILWGPELIKIYNDRYAEMIGPVKDARALGAPAKEIWSEIWDDIGPMFDAVMNTGEATWSQNQVLMIDRRGFVEECIFTWSYSPMFDDDGQVNGILDVSVETTAEVVSERRFACSAELSRALSRTEHATDACVAAIGALTRHDADIVAADLLLEVNGQLVPVASNRRRRLAPVGISRAAEALATGEVDVISSTQIEDGPADHVIIPFGGADLGRGALVATLNPHRPFDADFRRFALMVARTIGAVIERAQRRDVDLGELQRVNETLQLAMLPSVSDSPSIAARYVPAANNLAVGGDWYDVVDLSEHRRALVVGDCVGHGLAAATAMAQLRSAMRALLLDGHDPGAAITALDAFAASVDGASCASLVCMIIDRGSHELTYCRAGHPPPLLVQPDAVRWLDEPGGPVLGVDPCAPRPNQTLPISTNDLVVLYTDGLVERRDVPLEEMMDRLATLVGDARDGAVVDLADLILAEMTREDMPDDVVAVVKRVIDDADLPG